MPDPVLTGIPKSLSDRSFDFGSPYFNGLAMFYHGGENKDLLTGRPGILFNDDSAKTPTYAYVDSLLPNVAGAKAIVGATDRDGIRFNPPTVPLTNDIAGVYGDFTIICYTKILKGGAIFGFKHTTLDQFITVNTFVDPLSADGTLSNLAFQVRGRNGNTIEQFNSQAVKGVYRMYAFRRQGLQLGVSINGVTGGFNTQADTGLVDVDGFGFLGRKELFFFTNSLSRQEMSLFVVYKRSLTNDELSALATNPFLALPDPSGIVIPPVGGYRKTIRAFHIGNSVTDTPGYGRIQTIADANGLGYTYGRHIIPGAPLEYLQQNPTQGFAQEPYGYPGNAFPNFTWDVLTLQPFDRGVASDVSASQYFIDLLYSRVASINARVLIYSRWHRQTEISPGVTNPVYDIETFWNDPSLTTPENKLHFEQVTTALRALYPTKQIDMIPVGDALLLLDREAKAGRVPGIATAKDVFADNIHFNLIGSYFVALCWISTMYKEDPVGLPFTGFTGVTEPMATKLKEIVWDTVLDHPFSGVTTAIITPPPVDPPPVVIPPPTPRPDPDPSASGFDTLVEKTPGIKLRENPKSLGNYL